MTQPDVSDPAWSRACRAAALFGRDPTGLVLRLRASPGPVRDRFLTMLASTTTVPVRRCPAGISSEQLGGGLDVAATLATGRRVTDGGLLGRNAGGVLVVASAERIHPALAWQLGQAVDGRSASAPIGLVLLDEGGRTDETPPDALLDRTAFEIVLDGVRLAEAVIPARTHPRSGQHATSGDAILDALCRTGEALGIGSARATVLALRVAELIARTDGRSETTPDDAAEAAALVLAPRAQLRPASIDRPEPQGEPESASDGTEREDDDGAGPAEAEPGQDDIAAAVLTSALGALPAELRALSGGSSSAPGRAGGPTTARGTHRGRPLPPRPGRPDRVNRLALIDTLRAAIPWQRVRERAAGRRLAVRGSDLRVRPFANKSRTVSVFVVDASGSAALDRLGEAKGAIELLLADCYVRRDQVALIAFRSRQASLLLPPTGALTRAKRSLAALPGGGATPLAAGLDAAFALACGLKRRGEAPVLVVLTDGRANVARDGSADRTRAMGDALETADAIRRASLAAIVVDIATRPQAAAAALAARMGARCVCLPQADPASLSRLVRQAA